MNGVSGEDVLEIVAAAWVETHTDLRGDGTALRSLLERAAGADAPFGQAAVLLDAVLRREFFDVTYLFPPEDPSDLATRSAQAALAVAHIHLARLGHPFSSALLDAGEYVALVEGVLNGELGVSEVAAWLADIVRLSSSLPDGQLAFEIPLTAARSPIRVYVASALTGLTDEQHDLLLALCSAIKSALAQEGIHAHCPTDYTDPQTTGDDPPDRAARIDYTAILRSDLVICIANSPSTGVGKELVWAERNGCMTLLIGENGARPSRLVTGTTAVLKEVTASSDPEAIVGEIRAAVSEHREMLMAHAVEREGRQSRHGAVLAELVDALPRVLRSLEQRAHAGLTGTRAREMVMSVDHLAGASYAELQTFADLAGLELTDVISPTAHDQRESFALGPREMVALRAAAEIEGWATHTVMDLLDRVTREEMAVGAAYRRGLRDARAWVQLHHDA